MISRTTTTNAKCIPRTASLNMWNYIFHNLFGIIVCTIMLPTRECAPYSFIFYGICMTNYIFHLFLLYLFINLSGVFLYALRRFFSNLLSARIICQRSLHHSSEAGSSRINQTDLFIRKLQHRLLAFTNFRKRFLPQMTLYFSGRLR